MRRVLPQKLWHESTRCFYFDVIPAKAGLSTAELVIHLLYRNQDQSVFPLSRE
jgi:hypothetical protein